MTSRLSYTSAAESDGEFCGEDLSPRRSGTLKQDPNGRLVRVASDPSLARGQEAAVKTEPGGDFSLPPSYTTQPQEVSLYLSCLYLVFIEIFLDYQKKVAGR